MLATTLVFFILSFSFAQGYDGNFGLMFDGTNDYVLMSHLSTDRYVEETTWTLEAWIKAHKDQNQMNQFNQQNIVGFPSRHPNLELCGPRLDRSIKGTDCIEGTLLTQVRDVSGVYKTAFGKIKVNDNKCHHVAATFDNQTLYLYVDGVLDVTLLVTPYTSYQCMDQCPYGFQIGGFMVNKISSQYFRGIIDEVRVWSTSRTQQQITSTMKQTVGSEITLLYYWRFDEAIGGVVNSRGNPGPGVLGGGILSAEPRWVESSAPIISRRDMNPFWNTNITGRYFAGAAFTLFSCMFGIVFGFLFLRFAPKVPFMKKLFDKLSISSGTSYEATSSLME